MQYKDKKSSVVFARLSQTAFDGTWKLKQMAKVETNCTTFTLFGTTLLNSYDKAGVSLDEHVTLIAPDAKGQQYPKIYVMDVSL